jgi:hypothetical protein
LTDVRKGRSKINRVTSRIWTAAARLHVGLSEPPQGQPAGKPQDRRQENHPGEGPDRLLENPPLADQADGAPKVLPVGRVALQGGDNPLEVVGHPQQGFGRSDHISPKAQGAADEKHFDRAQRVAAQLRPIHRGQDVERHQQQAAAGKLARGGQPDRQEGAVEPEPRFGDVVADRPGDAQDGEQLQVQVVMGKAAVGRGHPGGDVQQTGQPGRGGGGADLSGQAEDQHRAQGAQEG